MSPTADARTGRKAYADCRRDCRNTGINIQTGQREVNTRALLPAPGGGDLGVYLVERHACGGASLGLPAQFHEGPPSGIGIVNGGWLAQFERDALLGDGTLEKDADTKHYTRQALNAGI